MKTFTRRSRANSASNEADLMASSPDTSPVKLCHPAGPIPAHMQFMSCSPAAYSSPSPKRTRRTPDSPAAMDPSSETRTGSPAKRHNTLPHAKTAPACIPGQTALPNAGRLPKAAAKPAVPQAAQQSPQKTSSPASAPQAPSTTNSSVRPPAINLSRPTPTDTATAIDGARSSSPPDPLPGAAAVERKVSFHMPVVPANTGRGSAASARPTAASATAAIRPSSAAATVATSGAIAAQRSAMAGVVEPSTFARRVPAVTAIAAPAVDHLSAAATAVASAQQLAAGVSGQPTAVAGVLTVAAASASVSPFNLQARRQQFIARVMSEFAPAQTVVEAQERGEVVQLQDDAVYALDGLAAGNTLATQRDSAHRLAAILVTRRGRAALRSDAFAQQVLTAAAKVRGQRDAALATTFAAMLLALSQEDAHPSYIASQAAALLFDQLLQVEHTYTGETVSAASSVRGGGGVGSQGCGFISSQSQEDPFLYLGSGDGGDGSSAAAPPPDAAVVRALRLMCEGPLSRQVLCGLPALRSHVPLVLLALAQATSTHRSKVHFADRVKGNMRKLGVLEKLGNVVADRSARLAHLLTHRPAAAAASAGADPHVDLDVDSDLDHGPDVGDGSSDAVAHSRSLAAELHLALVVLENATFTCPENEERLLKMTVPPASATSSSAAAAVAPPPESQSPATAGSSEQEAGQSGGEPRSFVALVVDVVQLLSPHLHLDPSGRTTGGTAGGTAGDALAASPSDRDVEFGLGGADQGGTGAGGRGAATVVGGDGGSGVDADCVRSMRECVHVAAAVLMNMTHQHPDGVAQVAAAGGLEVMAALVQRCCEAPRSGVTSDPVGCSNSEPSRYDVPPVTSGTAGRAAILRHLEVVSVCMGLLINMVSTDPAHRVTLARCDLLTSAPRRDLSTCAPRAAGRRGGDESRDAITTASDDTTAAGGGDGLLPMLCRIVDAMEDTVDGKRGALPGGPDGDASLQVQAGSSGAGGTNASQDLMDCSQPGTDNVTVGVLDGSQSLLSDCQGDADGSQGRADGWRDSGSQREDGCTVVPGARRRVSSSGEEITEEQLAEDQQDGEASIIQVYAAMLLGFIIQDSAELCAAAAAHLRAGSLRVVVAAIERCLGFYVSTGAITDVGRETLAELLVKLQGRQAVLVDGSQS